MLSGSQLTQLTTPVRTKMFGWQLEIDDKDKENTPLEQIGISFMKVWESVIDRHSGSPTMILFNPKFAADYNIPEEIESYPVYTATNIQYGNMFVPFKEGER